MPILSDSESACSDFEVISSSISYRVYSAGSIRDNNDITPSDSTCDVNSPTCAFKEIIDLSSLISDSSRSISSSSTHKSMCSSLSSSQTSETTVTNIEDLEEVPTMRATSNIHPAPIRRERRDTDRRSLRRKSEGDKNEKAKEGTIVKELSMAIFSVVVAIIGATLAFQGSRPSSSEIELLKSKNAELELTNKILLSYIRDSNATLSKMEAEIATLKEKTREHEEQLSEKDKELYELKEKQDEKVTQYKKQVETLKLLAEEVVPDRYGFDIPFKMCFEILDHEKLCRIFAEGLKSIHDFE